ncbi:MAG: ROK family transcriptional regulator [Actinomycetota bacterium]
MVSFEYADGGPAASTPLLGQRGVASSAVRRSNLSLVLTHLHLAGPATRSELCDASGLTRSSVAALVGDLEEAGLVTETPTASDGRPGRPSPRVDFVDGPAVLALEIQVDSVAAAWVSLGGQQLSAHRCDRPRSRLSVDDTLHDLAELARLGAEEAGRPRLLAVGVSVPGLTAPGSGSIASAPNLGWRDVPVRELLQRSTIMRSACGSLDGVPVDLQNHGDSGALAELRRGAGRGYRHLIFVDTEVGMGSGVVSGAELMRGADGFSGELGHMVVNPNGRVCACGSVGCLETEAGERALLARAGLNPAGGRAELDRLIAQAEANEPTSRAALDEVARWLGIGLGNIALLLNPEVIVLGGVYQRAFRFVEQTITDQFSDRPLLPLQDVTLVPSAIGPDAALVGASELAFDRVLTDPIGLASGTVQLPARR